MDSSRRALLATLGVGSLGLLASSSSADVSTAGTSGSLDQQYLRNNYVTAPASAFDPTALEAGEQFWVTDTGEIGVWDGQEKLHPGYGSENEPVGDSHFTSVSTDEKTITDPDGQGQLRWYGLNADNSLQDEDGGEGGFRLDNGVVIEKHPDNDSTGYTRLTLGQDVGIGVRKNNTLEDGSPGGTGEFIKNNPRYGYITLENDFDNSSLIFESKEGGGFEFKTSDPTTDDINDELRRLFITDPDDDANPGAEVQFERLDGMGIASDEVRFYGRQSQAIGAQGRTGILKSVPDQNQLQLSFGDGNEWVVRPDGYTESFRVGKRVTIGNASANRHGHHPPQDVRNISSPQTGDVAFHDGSGSNTEGPAHYTSGGSWVSTVDGSTIS